MESSNVVIDDSRLKSNNYEDKVVVVDNSLLEKVVETSIGGRSNLDKDDT